MRALLLCIPLAACNADVVSGSYLCGPEELCPDGQKCNGTDDKASGLVEDSCVLSSLARPFVCSPAVNVEPDDSMAQAHALALADCVSVPFVTNDCMLASDAADWVSFVPSSVCTAVKVEARVTFPIAYEDLGLTLWDIDHNMQVGTDKDCPASSDEANVRRCLDVTLVPGTKYGIEVKPTGEGTCNGACAYNRYSLSVQLSTPG